MTGAQSHPSGAPGHIPGELHEVSEGVFAYIQHDGSWWINNTGFLVGRRGVVSVDACSTERRTRAYIEQIRARSDQPVRTLVNTHHHGDHTFGNWLFDGATIVGHKNVRAALLAWGPPKSAPFWTDVEWGEVVLEPPFLTYDDSVTLHVDELECQVTYVGTPAHTNNDSFVWLPARRVVFTGDLAFNGGTPFMLQGSIAGALQALARIAALRPEIVVPGHGPVCGPEVLDDMSRYLRFVQTVASEASAAGLSPLEAARETAFGEFAHWLDSERLVGNLHRAYAEIGAAGADAPPTLGVAIDNAAALNDMVAFNGGVPLTSHA